MKYRKFGNTGQKISALGFGCMRLPEVEENGVWRIDEDKAIPMLHRAFELGVNYFDTAYGYCHGNSEYAVGKAIKGFRDKVMLSTKLPTWKVAARSDYRKLLEEQLKKLDTDHIDFYHFHALNKTNYRNTVLKFNLLDEAAKAKSEGLIRHISFSFHDKPEVMKEIIDSGAFESVLCQYNLLDRTNEEMISYAAAKGLGVVIMGPVGGGRLSSESELITGMAASDSKSTPEIALKFVLGNPSVSSALSGMNMMAHVEENARVASMDPGSFVQDHEQINRKSEEMKKLSELYCTGCNYCMPCPAGINIPHVFSLMNYHNVYGLTSHAKARFAKLGPESKEGHSPADCRECGICETKCPQNIKIIEKLKETMAALS
ncbi:MAG: aldo/keto reductase [Eubacteriales bacterium]|nr:aldo/keto reductase [Eubacteriales bacterium]